MSEKKTVFVGPSFLNLMILLQIILIVLKYAGGLAAAPLWAVWLPSLFVIGSLAVIGGIILLFILAAFFVEAVKLLAGK